MLLAMESLVRLKKQPPQAGLEPGPTRSVSQYLTRRAIIAPDSASETITKFQYICL